MKEIKITANLPMLEENFIKKNYFVKSKIIKNMADLRFVKSKRRALAISHIQTKSNQIKKKCIMLAQHSKLRNVHFVLTII